MDEIRPSALNNADICNGYAFLPTEGNAAASRGTKGHALLERMIRAKQHGMRVNSLPKGYFLNRAVNWAWEWLDSTGAWGTPDSITPEMELPSAVMGLAGGHADVVLGGANTVIDWKFGAQTMLKPIEQDLQMIAYGVQARAMMQSSSVLVYRVQPDNEVTESIVVTGRHTKLLNAVVNEIHEGRSEYNTGPQCKWCFAWAHCPRMQDLAGPLAITDLGRPIDDSYAVRAARVIPMLRKQLDVLEGNVKGYLQQRGPLYDPVMRQSVSVEQQPSTSIEPSIMPMLEEAMGKVQANDCRPGPSKKAITDKLKLLGWPESNIKRFFSRARRSGHITESESATWKRRKG